MESHWISPISVLSFQKVIKVIKAMFQKAFIFKDYRHGIRFRFSLPALKVIIENLLFIGYIEHLLVTNVAEVIKKVIKKLGSSEIGN